MSMHRVDFDSRDSVTFTAVSVWCGFQTVRLQFDRPLYMLYDVMFAGICQGNTIEVSQTLTISFRNIYTYQCSTDFRRAC